MIKVYSFFCVLCIQNVLLMPISEIQNEPSSTLRPIEKVTTVSTTKTPVDTSSSSSSEEEEDEEESSEHRFITFDQRQNGKYNLRADFSNIAFLFIPSQSSSSLNLLELITKAAHKKSNVKHAYRKPEIKSENVFKTALQNREKLEQFVEGRTPYKVDISSIAPINDIELEKDHSKYSQSETDDGGVVSRQLSILPVGSLIPVQVKEVREDENKSVLKNNRIAKSLPEIEAGGEINHNSVVTSLDNNERSIDTGYADYAFDRLNIGNLDTLSDSDRDQYDKSGYEYKLIGATEQCGPYRRRDSYGVCRFVRLD